MITVYDNMQQVHRLLEIEGDFFLNHYQSIDDLQSSVADLEKRGVIDRCAAFHVFFDYNGGLGGWIFALLKSENDPREELIGAGFKNSDYREALTVTFLALNKRYTMIIGKAKSAEVKKMRSEMEKN